MYSVKKELTMMAYRQSLTSDEMALYKVIYANFTKGKMVPIGDRKLTVIEQNCLYDCVKIMNLEEDIRNVEDVFGAAYRYQYLLGDNKDVVSELMNLFSDLMILRLENLIDASVVLENVIDDEFLDEIREQEQELREFKEEISSICTRDEALNYCEENRLDEGKSIFCNALYFSGEIDFAYDINDFLYKNEKVDILSSVYKRDRGYAVYELEMIYDLLPSSEKLKLRLVNKYGSYLYNRVLDDNKRRRVYNLLLFSNRTGSAKDMRYALNVATRRLVAKNSINLANNLKGQGILNAGATTLDEIDDFSFIRCMYPDLIRILSKLRDIIPLRLKKVVFNNGNKQRVNIFLSAMMVLGWLRKNLRRLNDDICSDQLVLDGIFLLSKYKYYGVMMHIMKGCKTRNRQIIFNMINTGNRGLELNKVYCSNRHENSNNYCSETDVENSHHSIKFEASAVSRNII